MTSRSNALSLLAFALGAACGQGSPAEPDAATTDATPLCVAGDGGAPIPLRVGVMDETSGFIELADGQQMTLLWGFQGYLMLAYEVAAQADLGGESDSCMQCRSVLTSPTGAFLPSQLDVMLPFTQVEGEMYSTGVLLVLAENQAKYHEAAAELVINCEGQGYTGETERMIGLIVPPR